MRWTDWLRRRPRNPAAAAWTGHGCDQGSRHPAWSRSHSQEEPALDPTIRSPKMARLEAALLVAPGALSPRRLAQMATLVDAVEARELIDRLNTAYELDNAPFRIDRVATGYQLLTLPEYCFWLDKLHHRQASLKLSPPAMETLTIVAYRQPVIRADVEQVRGVQCTEMLKQLMDRGLVKIVGEDDSLGRPYLYGTTRLFLETFGLRNLDDLPMSEKLRPKPEAPADDLPDDSVVEDPVDEIEQDEAEESFESADGEVAASSEDGDTDFGRDQADAA